MTEGQGTEGAIPSVFTPDNEPYLGSQALYSFDQEIPRSLAVSSHIASYTREKSQDLTALQRAACQIVPQSINLALSIRELLRQGYLFAALVLTRPLIERAAIISYILDHPEAVEKWHAGWRFRDRPSLSEMLLSLGHNEHISEDAAKELCEYYGHVIHGDPVSADSNLVSLRDGSLGYAVGKVLDQPGRCDLLALHGWAYLRVLTVCAARCFPEVKPSGK